MPSRKDTSKATKQKASKAKPRGNAEPASRGAAATTGGATDSAGAAGGGAVLAVENERANFRQLIAANPNHFGGLADSPLKPVFQISNSIKYEEISCVGFDPRLNVLQATIKIKLPTGYSGGLCAKGSTEYVRFYVDYGSGWQDAGYVGVNVHDIPNGVDCARIADKPLCYVATLNIEPKRDICRRPVMPNVRAILSWEHVPPANMPNWSPPWGNVRDRHIQVRPRDRRWGDVFTDLDVSIFQKLDLPPLAIIGNEPIPLPDPPPLGLAELAQLYGVQTGKRGADASTGRASVEPHRFALSHIESALQAADLDTGRASGSFAGSRGGDSSGGGSVSGARGVSGAAGVSDVITNVDINQQFIVNKIDEFAKLGIDWQIVVGSLYNTSGNVTYEQLDCLGLDYSREWLTASFTLKKQNGYSGSLCTSGSKEYVAFWADWDNTCEWTYVGTASIDVHDIPTMPADGLRYTVNVPVDFTQLRQKCSKPKIARVRAVLSWSSAPSTTNPDAMPYWGNRVDTHVQIKPGEVFDPNNPEAKIRSLGGIPIEMIDVTGDGMTLPGAKFWYDDIGAYADAPFGGTVLIHGQWVYGYKYRIRVHREGEPDNVFTTAGDSFWVLRNDVGSDLQTSTGGFFTFLNPAVYFEHNILGSWNTSGLGDEKWEVKLDIADMSNNVLASSPWYKIQLDNTWPVAAIQIDNGGDCKDFDESTNVNGHFVATDAYFGGFSLYTLPANNPTIPVNNPTTATPSGTPTAPRVPPSGFPWSGGDPWTLNTASPNHMKPCGYVVRVEVFDRTIVGSNSSGHHWSYADTGLCLRAKK